MVAGDSLTQGLYATTAATSYYGQLKAWLESRKLTVKPQVYGAPPRAAGIAAQAATISAAHPDIFVLEIGTNDVSAPTPVPDFTASLQSIVDTVKAANAGAQIIMLTTWQQPGTRPDYDAAIASVAAANGAVLVDISAIKDNPDNSIPAGIATFLGASDGWHPNDAGHAAIYAVVRSAIEELL